VALAFFADFKELLAKYNAEMSIDYSGKIDMNADVMFAIPEVYSETIEGKEPIILSPYTVVCVGIAADKDSV
jgi:hypothetical protein